MRIGLFARTFSPSIGGLERIAGILATEFARKGHIVLVITDTPAASLQQDTRFPFSVIRTQTARGRIAAFKEVDVILLFNVSLPGVLAAWRARKPMVMSHHGIYRGAGIKARLLEWVKRQLTRYYPNISVSRFVARHIPGRSVVINNAYDMQLFSSEQEAAERCRDFVFCGRLVPEKGALICLQAFREVLVRFHQSSLTIIGDGPELDEMRGFAEKAGISRQIVFTGPIQGISLSEELRRHSCLVVPSIWEEPFGIVALEGIACCDTVIAANRGGLPEALGDCGVLAEPTVPALSAAMTAVLEAKASRRPLPGQMKSEIRARYLAEHAPSFVASRYLDVLENAIQRDGESCPDGCHR